MHVLPPQSPVSGRARRAPPSGAVLVAGLSALLLSACGGSTPAGDPSLVDIARPTDQPCAVVAATPASGATNTLVNLDPTVVYTGPRPGTCQNLRLTDSMGNTIPADVVLANEWANPSGGIVGTLTLHPRADLFAASDFTLVRADERLLGFRTGSRRAGTPVSVVDRPAGLKGLPTSAIIQPAQINDLLEALSLQLANGSELVAKGIEAALSLELKQLASPGATRAARIQKLTYTSLQPDGSPVQLTGLMVLPVNPDGSPVDYANMPVVVSQHGSQSSEAAAPSSAAQIQLLPGLLAAGKGHIFLAPDLIGIGDTAHLPQAYLITKDTAAQTRDMLLAARRHLLDTYGAQAGQTLRIVGASQGGHSAMAALPPLSALGSVKLVSALAGPYDLNRTFSGALLAIAGETRDPYAAHENLDLAPSRLRASLEALSIYQNYRYEPGKIFAADGTLLPSFLADFKAGRYDDLKAQWGAGSMASNSQRYIAPDAKVVLYHFTTDALVPSQNTVDMLSRLKNGPHQLASVNRGNCRESSVMTKLILELSKSPLATHTLCAAYQFDDLIGEL